MDASSCLDGRMAWLSNGEGRYREALVAAEQGRGRPNDLGLGTLSVVELIEAAVRCGQMERARSAFDQLVESTSSCSSDWALGITARCRALVSSSGKAEPHYREALEHLSRTSERIELARAHLLYGEWLRRMGRRVDARAELRAAHGMFLATGATGFTDRANRELLATGETVRRRSVDTFAELTPQEAGISRLAGAGYTNSEIAIKMFLSERTVEWHLRKVFAKLGIRSRRQLRDVSCHGDVALASV